VSTHRLLASPRASKRRKAFSREVIGRSALSKADNHVCSKVSISQAGLPASLTNVRERSPKFRQRISRWQDSRAQSGHSGILLWKPACAGAFEIDFSVR